MRSGSGCRAFRAMDFSSWFRWVVGVFETGRGVVDRAGADDDEEAGIAPGEDVPDGVAGGSHEGGLLVGPQILRHAEGRGGQRDVLHDVQVGDFRGGVHGWGRK